METLAKLKPAFKPEDGGKVTAGNSLQITDGASAVLIMSEEKADELGLTPRARFHTFALAGVDPVTMLTGPIPATQKVLERSGLTIDDIDLVEINEAFASVVLAWEKELQPDMDKVNVNGGAIALGHPLGCSGAKLMATLLNELERTGGRYGLQTMCEGGGLANATIIERLGLTRPPPRCDRRSTSPGRTSPGAPASAGAPDRRPCPARRMVPRRRDRLPRLVVAPGVVAVVLGGRGRCCSSCCRSGVGLLGGFARPVPEPPPGRRAAQGQADLPVLDLRHRGAHDRGERRGPRAATPLHGRHGPR